MTESEWIESDIPEQMLQWIVARKPTSRKLRLLASACVRWVYCQEGDAHPLELVTVSERCADGEATLEEMRGLLTLLRVVEADTDAFSAAWAATNAVHAALEEKAKTAATQAIVFASLYSRYRALEQAGLFGRQIRSAEGLECSALAAVVREILGNPFRVPALDPAWLPWEDQTIPRLANFIYTERLLPEGHLDPTRLAILADALEDAGCTDPDILEHMRSPGPHVRGCWAVDLLLGKQ
jgi:hypothetical protein